MKLASATSALFPFALSLFVGCGEGGPIGNEGFEKGLPVINTSDLKEIGSTQVDFVDAPADVYEGNIGIWFYKDQPFTGWAVAKHDNGRLERKEFLQTGLQHGLTTTWYEDGQPKSESNWHYGLPDGLEVMWHGNGEVHVMNYWQRGMVLIKKAWDENGNTMIVNGWNEDGTPKTRTSNSSN